MNSDSIVLVWILTPQKKIPENLPTYLESLTPINSTVIPLPILLTKSEI